MLQFKEVISKLVSYKADILFLASIVSIFLTNTLIYPIVFSFFILFTITEYTNKKGFKFIETIVEHSRWQFYLFVFIFWALFVTLINVSEASILIILKLIINLMYLSIIPFYLKISTLNKKWVFFVIEAIILLNLLQLFYVYIKLDLFPLVFTGQINDSSTAYIITSNTSYLWWGSESKNIWATKIALIQIVYLFAVNIKFYNISSKKFVLFFIFSIINLILSLGRTGQLAFFVALGFLYLQKLYRIENKKKKIYSYVLTFLGFLFVIPNLFEKLFHINFDKTDGGFIRLLYWKTFLINYWDTNFIIGNGITYARIFLKEYAPYYIGENNMHNVFLNMLLDWGIIGTAIYVLFLINLIKKIKRDINFYNLVFMLLTPLFIISSLQYLGYDNDIVIYLALIYIITDTKINKRSMGDLI